MESSICKHLLGPVKNVKGAQIREDNLIYFILQYVTTCNVGAGGHNGTTRVFAVPSQAILLPVTTRKTLSLCIFGLAKICQKSEAWSTVTVRLISVTSKTYVAKLVILVYCFNFSGSDQVGTYRHTYKQTQCGVDSEPQPRLLHENPSPPLISP